jgi:thymidine kinase
MFSGKTEELMRRLRRAEYAKQRVLTIKYHIDQRYNRAPTCIVSHAGRERFAFVVTDDGDSMNKILELAQAEIDTIGLDEVHFFSPLIVDIILQLVNAGKRVIIAGLELDFRGEPFAHVAKLLALADDVTKLKAICVQCGAEGHFTQRIVNGAPASYDDPVIVVGAAELYEARCRNCFAIDKGPFGTDQTSSYTAAATPKEKPSQGSV